MTGFSDEFNSTDFSSLFQSESRNDHGENQNPDENVAQYLTFLISNEIFGAKVSCIKEIIEYGIITRVPLTPKYLRGVINLRGNVVPVVDMAIRLGKKENTVGKKTCIIILETLFNDERVDIGFVVDEVDKVMNITQSQLMASPEFGVDIRTEFIDGILQFNKKTIIFLNLNIVLSVDELKTLIEMNEKQMSKVI